MFATDLKHKYKLRVGRELKREIGFVECLQYVKGHLLDCSLISFRYPWVVSELGRHTRGVGHRSVLIMGLARSQLACSF